MQKYSATDYETSASVKIAFDAAFSSQKYERAKEIISASKSSISFLEVIDHAVYVAISKKNIEFAKWAISEFKEIADMTYGESVILRHAASKGLFDFVKWLVKESGVKFDIEAKDSEAVRYAIENGHLGVAKFLVEEIGNSMRLSENDENNEAVLFCLDARNSLKDIKWLLLESGLYFDRFIDFSAFDCEKNDERIRLIARECYGVEDDYFDYTEEVASIISRLEAKPELLTVSDILDSAGLYEVDERADYLTSKSIQKAARLGMVSNLDHLKAFLKNERESSSERRF